MDKLYLYLYTHVYVRISAGCILLGVIIYGSKMEHNLSWSFALCCIAGIIFAVDGLLLLVDSCKR